MNNIVFIHELLDTLRLPGKDKPITHYGLMKRIKAMDIKTTLAPNGKYMRIAISRADAREIHNAFYSYHQVKK